MQRAKQEKEIEKKVADAKSVIVAAATQGFLWTVAEEKRWRKDYNRFVNEGSEGYVPYYITVEQVEAAKAILKQYEQPEEYDEDKKMLHARGGMCLKQSTPVCSQVALAMLQSRYVWRSAL